jgi:MFS transporter, NNP family, nitrate/nitrite transporter
MSGKANRLNLPSLSGAHRRVFHLTWMAFFVCFFAWFAVAPLMPVIRGQLQLSKDQIANINIAAVFAIALVLSIIRPRRDGFGALRECMRRSVLGATRAIGASHA